MDPVLENVLVELVVDLPADADVPIVASVTERTWLWSDLHLSDPVSRANQAVAFAKISGPSRSRRFSRRSRRISSCSSVRRRTTGASGPDSCVLWSAWSRHTTYHPSAPRCTYSRSRRPSLASSPPGCRYVRQALSSSSTSPSIAPSDRSVRGSSSSSLPVASPGESRAVSASCSALGRAHVLDGAVLASRRSRQPTLHPHRTHRG